MYYKNNENNGDNVACNVGRFVVLSSVKLVDLPPLTFTISACHHCQNSQVSFLLKKKNRTEITKCVRAWAVTLSQTPNCAKTV